MSIATLSNLTATVQRKTISRDGFGSSIESWGTSSTQKVAVQPVTGKEADSYSREEYSVTHKGYMAGSPDVVVGDRLLISSIKYLVRAALNTDMADHHLKLLLEQEV